MTGFPWEAAMRFGLGVLRLSPAAFWAMSPRELSAAYHGVTGGGPVGAPDRQQFEALQGVFPDKETAHAE